MKMTLISPFRTLLNINSDIAFSEAESLYETLTQAARRASEKTGAAYSALRSPPEEMAFTKYSNLDNDHSTWFSTPLVKISASASAAQKLLRRDPAGEAIKFLALEIHVFDFTLAVVRADIELDLKKAASQHSKPSDLEESLTSFSNRLAAAVQRDYVQPLISLLQGSSRNSKSWRAPLLRKPEEFLVFDDLAGHHLPMWDESRDCLVWTHRIFHMPTLESHETQEAAKLIRVRSFPPDTDYHIKWGTSYILESGIAERYISMNILNQYFYWLFNAIADSQKRLMRSTAYLDKRIDLGLAEKRYFRQEDLTAEFRNELLDCVSGLQDLSAEVFEQISESFDTNFLIESIRSRSKILGERIERAIRRRDALFQRFLSFGLIVLGASQIIQLVQNFFWYTAEAGVDDSVYGVTNLIHSLSFDLTMNAIFTVILVGATLWVVRRKKLR